MKDCEKKSSLSWSFIKVLQFDSSSEWSGFVATNTAGNFLTSHQKYFNFVATQEAENVLTARQIYGSVVANSCKCLKSKVSQFCCNKHGWKSPDFSSEISVSVTTSTATNVPTAHHDYPSFPESESESCLLSFFLTFLCLQQYSSSIQVFTQHKTEWKVKGSSPKYRK